MKSISRYVAALMLAVCAQALSAQGAEDSVFVKNLSCHDGLYRVALPKTLTELRKIGPLQKEEHVDTIVWGDNSKSLIKKLYFDGLVIQLLSDPRENTYSIENVVITTPNWSITPGFRVGELLSVVLVRLGIRQKIADERIKFVGEADSVIIQSRDGRLSEVSVHCYTG